jgi:hypothetical protein
LIKRHRKAWKHRSYHQSAQEESKKNLYMDTESNVIALEEMVSNDLGSGFNVNHGYENPWHSSCFTLRCPRPTSSLAI